jgi:hypothetical protein
MRMHTQIPPDADPRKPPSAPPPSIDPDPLPDDPLDDPPGEPGEAPEGDPPSSRPPLMHRPWLVYGAAVRSPITVAARPATDCAYAFC